MSDRLDQAVAEIRKLPAADQQRFADALLVWATTERSRATLTPEQARAVDAALRRTSKGDFADTDEVNRVFNKAGIEGPL